MRIAVYGLGHLGCVTAACLAAAGHRVTGFDPDPVVVDALRHGQPPAAEPGLAALVATGLAAKRLAFPTTVPEALADAQVLWITFDTPLDEEDRADVTRVRSWLDAIVEMIPPGMLVVVSSQVPVGFTADLARAWATRELRFACVPENLRLGSALDGFRRPERVVVGVNENADRSLLAGLVAPEGTPIEWMSVESAEMTKHALNAFLASSVAFANELARLCDAVGADAAAVERGMRSDRRVGPHAYVSPGAPFAGGTLARDVRFLEAIGARRGVATPLLGGVLSSNAQHQAWCEDWILRFVAGVSRPVAAILGLAYKVGTDSIRRSLALATCRRLIAHGVTVRAHDPAVHALPADLGEVVALCTTPEDALTGADVAVLSTPWPLYRGLTPSRVIQVMRRPQVVDPSGALAATLGRDDRLLYATVGRRSGA